MIRRLATAILVSLLSIALIAAPALAIADPDNPSSINNVTVYEDLLETGDAGVLISYFIDYAVPPTETATEAYMAVFIDTDSTTQLKSVAPYAFDDDGYGAGIIWMYFTAAEVTAFGLDSTDQALYSIWITGNPTLAWVGDPPKTTGGIDTWNTTGDPNVLLAVDVLNYAGTLGTTWSLNLLTSTSIGNRLSSLGTSSGESYFTNAIPNLRLIAPNAFAIGIESPIYEDLDYTTSFGAVMTDDTGTVVGSPITLVSGNNTVNVTVIGTFTLELEEGTTGTMTDGTGTVTSSPVDLVPSTTTVTVTVIGTFVIAVALTDTQAIITDSIIGTGFDLTTVATRFGMSRTMFSGMIWLLITVIICAVVYRKSTGQQSGKTIMFVFNICIIGGAVLGLVPVIVAALLFIGFGALTAYVLFFRPANI